MQHGPRRLVTSQPKHALQSKRADPVLLVGDVPNCSEPDSQFGSCLVEYGTSGNRRLMFAVAANQSAMGGSIRCVDDCTLGAHET
jgi:hypothetical protein